MTTELPATGLHMGLKDDSRDIKTLNGQLVAAGEHMRRWIDGWELMLDADACATD